MTRPLRHVQMAGCLCCLASLYWMVRYPANFTDTLGAAADAVFRVVEGVIA